MKRTAILLITFLVFVSCNDKRALVVGKIQKASKLATTEFTIDKLVFGVKNKRILWAIKLNEAQFVAKSQAIVKTGINLEKIKPDDVKVEGRTISLLLPPVEVINFSYPAERFSKVDLLSTSAFTTRINLEDQEEFFRQAELDIRNSLQHMGVVEATQEKTGIMLKTLLKSLGYNEIYIDFQKDILLTEISLSK